MKYRSGFRCDAETRWTLEKIKRCPRGAVFYFPRIREHLCYQHTVIKRRYYPDLKFRILTWA